MVRYFFIIRAYSIIETFHRMVEQKSLIITSNLEFSQWNRIFVDARLTAAIVDRVIHHAHILCFTGDSYRVKHALSKHNQ